MQKLSSDADEALKLIQDVQEKLTAYEKKGKVIGAVLKHFKLPPLNLNIIQDASEMVNGLEELWRTISHFNLAT